MLKYGQVIEVHGRLFGTCLVIDRYVDRDGAQVADRYECATDEELLSVLDALGCDFVTSAGK